LTPLCDNAEAHRGAYANYFTFFNDPANGFRALTLPSSRAVSNSRYREQRRRMTINQDGTFALPRRAERKRRC
jgi:hypothetical protein